jgi:PadR family transcriptional regulator PadR
MMAGRGRGRGRGGRRRRVMSFLQPCLMLLLRRGQAHGYSLLDDLAEFGFRPGQQDPSLVYRALRDMEDEGIVTSEWDPDSLGPQRRVYRITAAGEQHLRAWIADLRRTRQEIDHLVEAYERMEMRKGGE